MKSFKLSSLPSSYSTVNQAENIDLKHFVDISLGETNELIFSSRIASNDRQCCYDLVWIESKLGLSVGDLNRDKQFIESIRRESEEKKSSIEIISKIDDLRQELSVLCEQIKERVENDKQMSRFKRRKLTEQIQRTDTLLKDNGTDIKTLENQKSLLKDLKSN